MKRFLQIIHLLLFLLAAVLILLFKAWSVEEDDGRAVIDLSFYLVLGIWPVISLLLLLLSRVSPGTAPFDRLIDLYKKILNSLPFLILSNVLVTVIIGYLLVLLLQYRQIEFTSTVGPVLVYEDVDASSNDRLVGVVNISAPLKRRFRVTQKAHELIFFYPPNKTGKAYFLRIKPVWKDAGEVDIQIKF